MLSLRSGKSIICDSTVSGKGTFLYAVSGGQEDFDAAFDAFLYANKLFVIKNGNLWTVSKIRIETEEDGRISMDSCDSTPAMIFEKISEKTGKSITYETLPAQRASLHIKNQTVFDMVKLILQPYTDYTVEETLSGLQVVRNKETVLPSRTADTEQYVCDIVCEGSLYDVSIKNTRISEAVEKIFSYNAEAYSNFLVNDERIKSIVFTGQTLEQTLNLVLEQVKAEAVYAQGIWYLFQKNTKSSRNSVTERSRSWHTVTVGNVASARMIPVLTSKYEGITMVELSSSRLAVYGTQDEYEEIESYISSFDSEIETDVVHLKYIRTAELMNILPPAVTKDDIVDTGTGNSVFFIGTAEKKERFLEQLEEIDRPKKLVRYDLLILQYEKSSNLSWGNSASVRPSVMGDRTVLTGEVGNLLNINFDAITAFGLTFSEKINAAIAGNEAAVFADTTLYGLSGEKLTFRNTNTYRYKDATIDPSTGKESFSTVTREITSGLVLEIDGWVSGDDIITMQINTSVSKQGVDVSYKNGNPPPTSEKNITTKIRARNGEPVILSGLNQTEVYESGQGVPLLSRIPLLGLLFKSKDESKAKTEMTIYLMPHIEENLDDEEECGIELQLLEFLRKKGGEGE